ncbi:MAG: thiosulfate oxidation carrier complex protein SoxZ [Acidiferrobacteraceae bacterium]
MKQKIVRRLGQLLVPLLALASTASYGQSSGVAGDSGPIGTPKLTVTLPSKDGVSEYYYVQPVNIVLTNAGKTDGLATLRIDVATNPEHHQQVLVARFSPGFRIMGVGTRVRLAGTGHARVEVQAETRSGKKLAATGQIRLRQGVDFSDAHGLTKRLLMNVQGLKGPVGTARARLWAKGELARQFSATIHHPMLPAIGGNRANLLKSLTIPYRGTRLGQLEFGDAISNDPYVDIKFMDIEPGVGPVEVQWRDLEGRVYEPAAINIRK